MNPSEIEHNYFILSLSCDIKHNYFILSLNSEKQYDFTYFSKIVILKEICSPKLGRNSPLFDILDVKLIKIWGVTFLHSLRRLSKYNTFWKSNF